MPRRPNFYPRPPRGGRHYLTNMSMAYFQFLSTPSARRATSKSRPSIKPETFLSTPSARRATRYPGGDGSRLGDFYPRPPRGGRPRLRTRASLSWYFYPRPPRGGRHFRRYRYGDPIGFLSTPSARRATIAPFTIPVLQIYFYPRPPRGGRPDSPVICGIINYISIHALREEGDHFVHHLHHHPADFYPRPPRGGRPHMTSYVNAFHIFLSTPSARRATREPPPQAASSQFLSTPSARRATGWGRWPQ